MHNYLKEYFKHMHNRHMRNAPKFEICYDFDKFLENTVMYFSEQIIIYEANTNFPHIRALYDIYCDSVSDNEPLYNKKYFLSSYILLGKYTKELEILLRKDKIKTILSNEL